MIPTKLEKLKQNHQMSCNALIRASVRIHFFTITREIELEAHQLSSEVLKYQCVAEAAGVDVAKLAAEGGSAYKHQGVLAHKRL